MTTFGSSKAIFVKETIALHREETKCNKIHSNNSQEESCVKGNGKGGWGGEGGG